jgi:hypothetical protein
MLKAFSRRNGSPAPSFAVALASVFIGTLLLSSCGGSDGGANILGDDEDTSVLSAGVPSPELSSDESIVARPALGRLVFGTPGPGAEAAFKLLGRYFSASAAYSTPGALRAGDVLVLDGQSLTAADLQAADRLAAAAFAAQVPLLIIGFDDALEDAIHTRLPTASNPGYNSVALIEPPRIGQPISDGAITLTPSDAGDSPGSPRLTRSEADQLTALIEKFHAARSVTASARLSSQAANAVNAVSTGNANDGTSQCTPDPVHPESCGLVQQTALARIQIIEPFRYTGLGQPTTCLSRDWELLDDYTNQYQSRNYAAVSNRAITEFYEPQCPSQVLSFYPVLYLNAPHGAAASRVLYLGLNGSFSANVRDNTSNELAWYQTRRKIEVVPQASGVQWMSNLPATTNTDHTQSDQAGWSINGSINGKSSGQGGEAGASVGFSVNFSHTTTNVIPDWKLIDTTDAQAAIWRFEAQQASPYAVDGSTDATCAAMGNLMFKWDATHCRSLPRHVLAKAPDLSVHTASLQGMSVWDLTPANNALTETTFTLNTSYWFDAVGCTILTKHSTGGTRGETLFHPNVLKSPNCASNQSLPPNKGTWYNRTQRSFSHVLRINLSQLPIPAP